MALSSSEGKGNSTPVYFILNHDLQEFKREMYDLISKWKMFPACWVLNVKDYYGRPVSYKGITYDGSPRDVYWEYFDPFIKNGLIKIIDKFRDVYDQKGIDVSVAKNEIGYEIAGFIERFYQKIAVVDQGLIRQSKKDLPDQGVYGLRDVSGMILSMKQFMDRQVEARFHQKKKGGKLLQTSVRILTIIGGIATIVGVPFAVLSYKVGQKNEYRADFSASLVLSSLWKEYKQNLTILKDIAYDHQYIDGKIGAQLLNMTFSAHDAALSAGTVTDVGLAEKLQDIYTGVFRVADNAMQQTRTADAPVQIGLYKLIAQNYKNNETLLSEALNCLESYVKDRAGKMPTDNQSVRIASGYGTSRLNVVSHDATVVSYGLPELNSPSHKSDEVINGGSFKEEKKILYNKSKTLKEGETFIDEYTSASLGIADIEFSNTARGTLSLPTGGMQDLNNISPGSSWNFKFNGRQFKLVLSAIHHIDHSFKVDLIEIEEQGR